MSVGKGRLDDLCSGLSQDMLESLSTFRMEANMLRAQNGQEGITMDEAMRYLKTCNFNSNKALEIYKNYQKHWESFHLENLRPYREPLSSGIGARKMEIVGTKDSEGYPIVLFTVARHETFRSDHKTDMQLLFYTLDQAAESEAAKEKGIVFIIDMRDSQASDVRYITSVMSVLKDGYPIHIKMTYVVVSSKRLTKVMTALQKVIKYDLDKLKVVEFSELGSYFLSEQLPLSLGGDFVPRVVSPTHHQQQRLAISPTPPHHRTTDDTSVPSQPSLNPPFPRGRRGSDGSRSSREVDGVPDVGTGGGRSVNQLMGLFQDQSSPNKHPSSPSRTKPLPPAKKKTPQPSKGPLPQVSTKATPPSKPSIQSSVAGETTKPPSQSTKPPSQQNKPTFQQTKQPSIAASKVPLIPPNGRAHLAKSNSSDGLGKQGRKDLLPMAPKGKQGPPRGKDREETSSNGNTPSGGSVLDKIRNFTSTSSNNSTSQLKAPTKELSTSYNSDKSTSDFVDRRRANSADKPQPSQSSASPRRLRAQPLKPVVVASNKHTDSPSVSTASPPQSHTQTKARPTQYENVNAPTKKPPPPTKPPPFQSLSQGDAADYDNLIFSNRDSDVYENIGIGFAGDSGTLSGPLPPLPLAKSPLAAQHVRMDYENVEIGGKKGSSEGKGGKGGKGGGKGSPGSPRAAKMKEPVVEEDDETLFGKEGPPGMKTQETIYENFGPDKGNKLMSIEELAAHVEKLGKAGLATEYLRIRNEPITGAYKACKLPCNTSKNRYKDVICYDETRVQLKSIPGKDGSDYIHASYVDGFKKPKAYILTQGPKDKTVADFWRMIWEKQVQVIVMATKCVELGKRKCAQYWPEEDSATVTFDQYTITSSKDKVQSCESYDVRTLQLSFKGKERTLVHFQFLAWPDYGIPSSGSSITRLIFAVRSAQKRLSHGSSAMAPVVVHCSAGVGRSGAYCTIDTCLHEMEERSRTNLQGVVRKMRKQRAFSVQTEEQYEFCYRTILEHAKK